MTAIFGEDERVPLHFGDPAAEQEAYESEGALHYAGPAGLVAVTGPDRLEWLTALSSQNITEGVNTELLLLDQNGRIEHAAGVLDQDGTTYLLTETAEGMAEYLNSMRFLKEVEIEDLSGQYEEFLAVATPGADPGAESETESETGPRSWPEGTLTWRDLWPQVAEGGAQYFQGEHPARKLQVHHFLVPVAQADQVESSVGSLAAEATRISRWRPRFGTEVDDRAMPAELDWLRTAVHLEKGCYRGQESVARIVNLGKPPRRLVFLHLDGSLGSVPAPGDALELNGRQVGVITSVARHNEMGPIALALVRRGLDPSAQLVTGEIAAAQEVIVPVDGKSDHSPATRPGAELRRLPGNDLRSRKA